MNLTVTQIAMHHSSQYTVASKVDGSPEIAIPIEAENKIAPQLKKIPQHQKMGIFHKAVAKRASKNSKNINANKNITKRISICCILFNPKSVKESHCEGIISSQIKKSQTLGNLYRMPRYTKSGKKIRSLTLNTNTFVHIPKKGSPKIKIPYPQGLNEISGLLWIKSQWSLIKELDYNRNSFPKCNADSYLMNTFESNRGIMNTERDFVVKDYTFTSPCAFSINDKPVLYPLCLSDDPQQRKIFVATQLGLHIIRRNGYLPPMIVNFVVKDLEFRSPYAFWFKGKAEKYPSSLSNETYERKNWVATQLGLYVLDRDVEISNGGCVYNEAQPAKLNKLAITEPHFETGYKFTNTTTMEMKDQPRSINTDHSLQPPTKTEPAEPKKPKLTINLKCAQNEKKEEIKEAVVEEHTPVFLRHDILASRDITVSVYLKLWPWSRPIKVLHAVSFQSTDLRDEFEMVGCYKSKLSWIKVVVTGYAAHMKKEDVLDVLLNCTGKMEFIPCFIEFKPSECVFLLNQSEHALTFLHKQGLVCEWDGTMLNLVVSQTNLTLKNLPFSKAAVLKAKLNESFIKDVNTLNLTAFLLQPDNSHFIYLPLHYDYNQTFIMKAIKAVLPWESITIVDLSDNRLTSIKSFDFSENMPSLRDLNLSGNWLPTASTLACIKGMHLFSLKLEGNPLCHNFIEKEHYIEVIRLLFPMLRVLDGININTNVDPKRHFSVAPETQEFVNSFLEIFFRFIDSNKRSLMTPMYSGNAVFSIICPKEMKRNPMYKNLKEFYMWCRSLQDSINPSDPLEGTIVGGPKIVKYFTKWPTVMHDPYTFTVDVMLHMESSMIIKVTGLIKITAESMDQDAPIIEFSRTFVLITDDGIEYKISNDMMQISEASMERIAAAFKFVGQQGQKCTNDFNLKFDCPPDDDLKDKLTEVFMEITKMSKKSSERCLEMENWNLRKALEYVIKLEKYGSQTLEY